MLLREAVAKQGLAVILQKNYFIGLDIGHLD